MAKFNKVRLLTALRERLQEAERSAAEAEKAYQREFTDWKDLVPGRFGKAVEALKPGGDMNMYKFAPPSRRYPRR